MRYLLFLDVALAALGATITVVMGFVVLVMYLNYDALPSISRDLPKVEVVTVCAVFLGLLSGMPAYGLWRRRRWWWAAQAVLLISLPVLAAVVRAHVGSA